MRVLIPVFMTFCFALCITSCDTTEDPDDPDTETEQPFLGEAGKILSQELLASHTTESVTELLNTFDPLASLLFPPNYPVDVYKIIYETPDANNGITQTSGTLVVPRSVGADLPLASYLHGTILNKNDVPSAGSQEQLIGIGLAATGGYAVAITDYLGMGDGPGLHPYQHAGTAASAGVDMMRAARNFAEADPGIALNGQNFIFGYSQGGHAAMAVVKAIEEKHSLEFDITAAAPMAGAYDMSGTMADVMVSDQAYPAPYYLPYILFAFNDVYNIYESLDTMFADTYYEDLLPFFDGDDVYPADGINNYLPASGIPKEMLRPEVVEDFTNNPEHPLRVALADNDLYDWTPTSPIRIMHCDGDMHVPYQNAQVAYDSFMARGATNVELINPLEGGNHETCVLQCLLSAIAWFDELKE